MNGIPPSRVRAMTDRPIRESGDYVLYWMTAQRRATHNFALDHAIEHARALKRPLLVLEALRVGYPYASERFHRFVLDGMTANARAFAPHPVTYRRYVEPSPGAGSGLIPELAKRACLVVVDEYPCEFLPRMARAAAEKCDVAFDAVDGNGLLPLRATDRDHDRAYLFRRFLQRALHRHLREVPAAQPFAGVTLPRLGALPPQFDTLWPEPPEHDDGVAALLKRLPIDHDVTAVAATTGGAEAGGKVLDSFLAERLARYADERSKPNVDAQSWLSPYLHFGHVGAHQVFAALAAHEGWSIERLGTTVTGKFQGWVGMSANAEAFLDELVTWREMCFQTCARRDDYDRFESLPNWARKTLDAHRGDRREHVYTAAEFDAAATHDPLWNAAQTQLKREGRVQNYLRMLWGKKVLEWSPSPEAAIATLIELNNRYALDGRDPNSYGGIFWCLGRYDRPWAPERPVYGTIRYMSSTNTARKFRVADYVARYSP
jgi:deoxyribodipyrimidine photo-lyase